MRRRVLCVLLVLLAAIPTTAAETLRVGQEAPPFSLLDLYGRAISLDYLDGHPSVILFWSVTSPGTTALLEDFRAYQEQWGRDDLAILAVSVDGGLREGGAKEAVRDYVNRMEVIFPVLLDPGLETTTAYGVREYPTAVVIDAAGRISRVMEGSSTALRQELRKNLLVAMKRLPEGPASPAVANAEGSAVSAPASGQASSTTCAIPRARACTRVSEQDPSASDPAALAVRLCNCYGDADAARIMMADIGVRRLQSPDLRFARAHTTLLEGRTADARRAFEALREDFPREGWGEWGLSLVALAAGDADEALHHLQAAQSGGWSIPEAETAVMKYLEPYWRSNRPAPREEQFLAMFEDLDSVRACYRRLNRRG